METAPISRIIPMSVVDGPGSRTAVFLQGCNIVCAYCHNPETQKLCCSYGLCVAECPAGALSMTEKGIYWEERLYIGCDTYIYVCPHRASPKVKETSAKVVFRGIGGNRPSIRGITVSGEECSLYPGFLTELFGLTREMGLTCLMNSSGMVDLSEYPELLNVCDGVMLDVESWSPGVYRKLTGGDNQVVLQDLGLLAEKGLLVEARIVCKPDVVDAESAIQGIAKRLWGKLDFRLKLIAFRPYGVKGWMQNMEPPSQEYMEEFATLARACGFCDIIIT